MAEWQGQGSVSFAGLPVRPEWEVDIPTMSDARGGRGIHPMKARAIAEALAQPDPIPQSTEASTTRATAARRGDMAEWAQDMRAGLPIRRQWEVDVPAPEPFDPLRLPRPPPKRSPAVGPG